MEETRARAPVLNHGAVCQGGILANHTIVVGVHDWSDWSGEFIDVGLGNFVYATTVASSIRYPSSCREPEGIVSFFP